MITYLTVGGYSWRHDVAIFQLAPLLIGLQEQFLMMAFDNSFGRQQI